MKNIKKKNCTSSDYKKRLYAKGMSKSQLYNTNTKLASIDFIRSNQREQKKNRNPILKTGPK